MTFGPRRNNESNCKMPVQSQPVSLVLSIPGKTFVAGEYAILKGQPALLAATEPRFELRVSRGEGELRGIHPDSPAGRLAQSHLENLKSFSLEFVDPLGLGGLGASTAQFLGLYAFLNWRSQARLESEKYLDHQLLLKSYLQYAWNGEGSVPSGADLLAQERGHLALVDKAAGRISTHSWNFRNLGFYLLHTGVKLATHEHLRASPVFEVTKMQQALALIQRAFVEESPERESLFAQGLREYAAALENENLVAPHSLELLRALGEIPGVRAAKGCGAMGSDVIFVLVEGGTELSAFAREKNVKIIATEKSLTAGLQVNVLKGDLF